MAMQSGLVYGRLIVGQAKQILFRRAVSVAQTAESANANQCYRLITAHCGFAKYSNSPRNKFRYGEDAFFITENRFSNVLGEYKVKTSKETQL